MYLLNDELFSVIQFAQLNRLFGVRFIENLWSFVHIYQR